MKKRKLTAAEYLKQYASWQAQKLHLLSERELIVIEEALPPGIDYSSDKVQSSPDDGMLKKVIRIEKRTKQIDNKVEILTDQMLLIKQQIDDVPDAISSNVLWYRYIELWGWPKVAEKVGYTEDHTKGYLHSKALQDFVKVNTF